MGRDDVIEKVENLTEEAKETITETASEVMETVSETAETIVENIAETVIDTVGDLVTEPEGEKSDISVVKNTEIPLADISEPINPSKVEEELKSLNRHGEDEILLMVQKSEKEKSSILDLTEDLGQSEEDDKDLFP